MKKLVLAVSVLFSASVIASDTDKVTCEQMANVASVLMDARQKGVDIVEIVDIAKKTGVVDGMMPIIKAAYEVPEYSTPEIQRKAVRQFRERAYLTCLGVES